MTTLPDPESSPSRRTAEKRTERDAFGEVAVSSEAAWGTQTQRALDYFPQTGPRFPSEVARTFGWHKCAAAEANRTLGLLPDPLADAIAGAAREVADGRHDAHFPLSIWQTGSGTQMNMNANEVIANLANERLGGAWGDRSPVHPNDHVNRCQSSNDSFPTVMHIVVEGLLRKEFLPALDEFAEVLNERRDAFADVVKLARTHLQDAVPMRGADEFATWAGQITAMREHFERDRDSLLTVPQGGTAAGTGLNAHPDFAKQFCEELSRHTGRPFRPSPLPMVEMGAHDALATLSGHLNTLATVLSKMGNDLRLAVSGPHAGFADWVLPSSGFSSSIMPGKRNPVMAEALLQICMRVMGHHTTVTHAAASGLFQLNVAKPVLLVSVFDSLRLLAEGMHGFGRGCLSRVTANHEHTRALAERSPMLATALTPHIGYDAAVRVSREAGKRNIPVVEAVAQLGLADLSQARAWLVDAGLPLYDPSSPESDEAGPEDDRESNSPS